jgi:hypothetical protein
MHNPWIINHRGSHPTMADDWSEIVRWMVDAADPLPTGHDGHVDMSGTELLAQALPQQLR